MTTQWIFTGIVIALLAVLGWVGLRYLRLAREKSTLEVQVMQLIRQLEYGSRLKEKMTMMIAHDLQSPLHFLNVLSDHVARFADNNQLREVRAGTDEIKRATANIHAFVKEINLWTRSQQEHFNVALHPFPFAELAAELQQFFGEMLLLHDNILVTVYPEDASVYTNRDILKAILRNLIDNANKHTRHGEITLSLAKDGNNEPVLTLSDNGGGMLPADLQRINRRISEPSALTSVEPNSRLGYQIIIDFAHTLGYSLNVTSSRGVGTTVRLSGLQCSTHAVPSAEVVGVGELD